MQRLSAFVLHAIAAGIMAWGWFRVLDFDLSMDQMMRTQKGGYFLFLTNQGLALAWSCMVVSLFSDVFPSVATIRRVKRALLMMSLPIALVVSGVYWSLLCFHPRLILRPTIVARLPLPTDLVVHALPLFTLLIDFFLFEPKFPKTHVHKAAPASAIVFTIWYASFSEYCATFNGSFPYPFLTHNPFGIRVMIYTTIAGIALGCFRTLNALHA